MILKRLTYFRYQFYCLKLQTPFSSVVKCNARGFENAFKVRFNCSYAADFHKKSHLKGLEYSEKNEERESRLLKIAIIGVPNAGKSTVINKLVDRRVCPISSKVHTTRCKARAITITGDTQLVFLDTPGLVNFDESKRHHLEHAFCTDGESAMLEADVIGVVHDVSNQWTRSRLDPKVLRMLHLYPNKQSILILNKIDALKSKGMLLDIIRLVTNNSLGQHSGNKTISTIDHTMDTNQRTGEAVNSETSNSEDTSCNQLSELQVKRKVKKERGWSNFREVFMVSALLGDGMSDLKDYLTHISEPSPWLFAASQFTDQPSETIIVNTVKSRLLDNLPEEIPYNLVVTMEYFDFSKDGKMSTVVLVGCPTFRLEKLVMGSRGRRIRTIAREAEAELQSTFQQPVHLKVVVTSKREATPNSERFK